jgi:pilus assembly protein Flp/PilA
MKALRDRSRLFLNSEEGPTATEYAVMLALIIVVCIGAISGIGNTVSTIFTNVDAGLPTGSSS